MSADSTDELSRRVASLERQIQKLSELAGLSYEAPLTYSSSGSTPDEEVTCLLAEGKKIEAIKRYHELTGVGLAEAKNAVEQIERG